MDDNTIDSLREVLQDMTTNIELLSSGQRSGEVLISFIEDMLKTVEAWAAKYNVLVPALDHSELNYSSNLQVVSNPQVMEKLDVSLDLDQDATESAILASRSFVPHEGKGAEGHNQSVLGNAEIQASQEEHLRGKLLPDCEIDGEQPLPADGRQGALAHNSMSLMGPSGANPPSSAMMRTRSQDPGSFVADPSDSQTDSDGDRKAASKQEMGEVIESPDWLPKGWLTEVKTRSAGGSAGAKDKYFVDPNSQRRFRSKREVVAFLNTTTKRKRGRPRKTESAGKLPRETQEQSAEHARDATQESAQSVSKPAVVATSTLLSSQTAPAKVVSPPVITTSVTALVSDSGNTLPHPAGQPSEWLVYESLASLPFPVFEHLRLVESNASKGASACNTSPTLWPCMPGPPDSLKKPSASSKVDEKQPSQKGNEEKSASTGSAGNVSAAEAVPKRPKKAARKNAS